MHWRDVTTEEQRAPDVVGNIRALRHFRVTNKHQLRAIAHDEIWTPGINQARCRNPAASFLRLRAARLGEDSAPHEVPAQGCACGFWGLCDAYIDQYPYYIEGVMAVIEQWGRVVPGSHGWRSQYAKVVALCQTNLSSPEVRLDKVAKKYGVPILTKRSELQLTPPLVVPPFARGYRTAWTGGKDDMKFPDPIPTSFTVSISLRDQNGRRIQRGKGGTVTAYTAPLPDTSGTYTITVTINGTTSRPTTLTFNAPTRQEEEA